MRNLQNIFNKVKLDREDIIYLLSLESSEEIGILKSKAYETLKNYCGRKVWLRGLIEFSNICVNDCYYCGIRKSNKNLNRYLLSKEEIINTAKWCAKMGFGSIVLQSGEKRDKNFIKFVCNIVSEIKEQTISNKLPNGLGVTLCIGEQDYNSYKKLFDSGAHRYLLRIETSNEELFREIHPSEQSYKNRLECLYMLKDIGFQTGTGVMIGLPNQTVEDLADDILFFKKMDIDMIGMGPYIIHKDTPMADLKNFMKDKKYKEKNYLFSLKMIATTRIFLKDVNIASTTALQAINPFGREAGLSFGANIIMPLITPKNYRKEYQLYEGKPCIEDFAEDCYYFSIQRMGAIDREVGFDEWGDSKHFINKNSKTIEKSMV